MVTFPGIEGEMGVYPQHEHLITQVVPGEIIVVDKGESKSLAVGEGLVEITASRVEIRHQHGDRRGAHRRSEG
jgi:F-type H+-transporting ATPase subunit epsilon